MKILVVIAGLITGVIATAFTLLQDPLGLAESASSAPLANTAQLLVSDSLERGIKAEPAGILGDENAQVRPFPDSALRHSRLAVVLLDSAEGGAQALAVKLAATRQDNSLLRGRLAADSAWNLIWPGHGSLFLVGRDDYRSLLADQVTNLLTGQGSSATLQPRPITLSQRLLGAGGRLIQAKGIYREYWFPDAGAELELGLAED